MPTEAPGEASGAPDDLATVMEGALPSGEDDDAVALASVKRGLFGPPQRPLMLARYVLLERISPL